MKTFVVFLFFIAFIILFAGAAIGNHDLTPDTPPAPGNNSANSPALLQQSAGSGRCGSPYSVRSGDTLSAIARDCGVNLPDLLAANPAITNPDLIQVGQLIHIPGGSAAPQVVQAAEVVKQPEEQPAADVEQPAEQPAVVQNASPTPRPAGAQQGGGFVLAPFTIQKSQPQPTSAGQADLVVEAFETARAGTLPTLTPVPADPADGYQPGEPVEVSVVGFQPNALVEVSIGQVGQQPVPLRKTVTDANGVVTIVITIPADAQAGQAWTVTVTSLSEPVRRATAEPFVIEP